VVPGFTHQLSPRVGLPPSTVGDDASPLPTSGLCPALVMDATTLAASLLESVPANRTFGITVESARDARAVVALDLAPELENVIGSLHASGLMALVDATGLAAMISLAEAPDQFTGIIPLATDAQLVFVAPARGRLRGHCELGPEDQAGLRELLDRGTDRTQLTSDVRILDEEGTAVCRGYMVWKLRRRLG
jgi:acyl-coenzyme A thioesterase PaaI-like protein